jgi:putative ABC transport system ATP-binding protein
MSTIIELKDITKIYQMGGIEVHALSGVSLSLEEEELTSIMGPSGSGKSTLMNIMGCLDKPSSGSYKLEGIEVATLDDDKLAEIRNKEDRVHISKLQPSPSGFSSGERRITSNL